MLLPTGPCPTGSPAPGAPHRRLPAVDPAPTSHSRSRAASGGPWGLTVSVAATGAFGVFFLVMAVLALFGGNGIFSGHVAIGLIAWGAVNVAAAVALARRAWWSRGPVVAFGLLHVLAFGQSMTVAPLAVVGVVGAVAAVVGAIWPSTRAALGKGPVSDA